ncbi:hypothetical protein SO802_023504 [Lithocarpus litseifolius]|uniref:PX domain-containing protein n=1 Tax=Lithocarpus litseifolius TaxID=425828 RepID=A0AAW2C6F4_9ROSI
MSEGGEVRSSELEMGLSSSEDRGVLEVISPSTPHKAWGIHCSFKEKDKKRIRHRFQFPSYIKIRIPDSDDRAFHFYADEVCFYEADFVSGLRLPIHPFIRELFFLYNLPQPTSTRPRLKRRYHARVEKVREYLETVLGESLYISRKYIDYEEKYVVAKSTVESLSMENESLKSQIFTLAEESRKDKEHLKTLEKSLDTKKAFSRLKDKQIDEALLKIEKAGFKAVEKFKASDSYKASIFSVSTWQNTIQSWTSPS